MEDASLSETASQSCQNQSAAIPRRRTQLRQEIRSHPDTYLQPSDAPSACRICWGEEDDEQGWWFSHESLFESLKIVHAIFSNLDCCTLRAGGTFLAPCKCNGTSRYVHARCLKRWIDAVAESKGVSFAVRCDVCRTTYRRLPPTMNIREQWPHRAYRFCSESWQHALDSPAGPLLRSFVASAWIYSSMNGIYFGVTQAVALPAMIMHARYDPLTALRPLVPGFAVAMILEPLLSSRDFFFHFETAFYYAFGWCLDAASRGLEAMILPALLPLPAPVQFFFQAAMWVPKGIGFAFQALDLSLMALYGGAMSGFLQGAFETAAAPFKALSFAARCGAGALGFLATALAQGAHGTVAAAQLIRRGAASP